MEKAQALLDYGQMAKASRILFSLAGSIMVLALMRIWYVLHIFYLNTASIAPGTPIRPMGLVVACYDPAIGSILVGFICACIGVGMSLSRRSKELATVSVLAAILSWTPLFVAHWGINHVIAARQLVMEE